MPPSAIAQAPYLSAPAGDPPARTAQRAKRFVPVGFLALLAVATCLSAGAQPRTVAVAAAAVFGLAFWIGRASGHARAVLQAVVAAAAANALLAFIVPGSRDAESLGWSGGDATALGLGLVATLALLVEKLHRSREPDVGIGRALAFLCETLLAHGWPALVGLSLIAAALVALPSRTGLIAAAIGGTSLLAASLLAPSLEFARPRARRLLIGGLAVLLLGLIAVGTFERAVRLHQEASIGGGPAEVGTDIVELASGLGVSGDGALAAVLLVLGAACAVGVRRRRRDAVYPCAGIAATALIAAQTWFGATLHGESAVFAFAMLLGVGTAQAFGRGRRASGV